MSKVGFTNQNVKVRSAYKRSACRIVIPKLYNHHHDAAACAINGALSLA